MMTKAVAEAHSPPVTMRAWLEVVLAHLLRNDSSIVPLAQCMLGKV